MTHEIGTCPKCGSWDVDDMGWEPGDCTIEQYGRCNECGCDFTDVFGYIETRWEEGDEQEAG